MQRHAGERTQAVGLALAAEQMSFTAVRSVRAGPFPSTLRAALEVAAEVGADWTVMIDGDVLLLPSAIPRLVRLASDHPPSTASVAACCLDRFTGTVRVVGVRCYRTSVIEQALGLEGWESALRPETELLTMLGQVGHETYLSALLVGIHDFEQYYRDLYRTAVVHGVKSRRKAEPFVRKWSGREADPETTIMLSGVEAGLRRSGVELDAVPLHEEAKAVLAAAGLAEREELGDSIRLDVWAVIDPKHRWLTRPTNVARLFPGFARRMSYKDGQPRRARKVRLAWRHRSHLRSIAPLRPLIRLQASSCSSM